MTEITIFLIILIATMLFIFIVTFLPIILLLSSFLKMWFMVREKNMKKLADEFSFSWKSNQPSFKKCLYRTLFSYWAIKEDWKTNFISGTLNGHAVFICDNLYTTAFDGRRTEVLINGQELRGKEFKNDFFKFQDGCLTSIWELKKIIRKYSE